VAKNDDAVIGTVGHLPRWLTLTTATAVLALAAGVVGLVFTFWPGLRPDPRVTQAAALSIAVTDSGILFNDYQMRVGAPASSGDTGCVPGNLYFVQHRLEGLRDRPVLLYDGVYNATTRRRVQRRNFNAQIPIERRPPAVVRPINTGTVRATHPTDQAIDLRWDQWPYADGRFFVRFTLFRGKTFLAVIDSATFKVTRRLYSQIVNSCVLSPR
jgi:hypothetical protein